MRARQQMKVAHDAGRKVCFRRGKLIIDSQVTAITGVNGYFCPWVKSAGNWIDFFFYNWFLDRRLSWLLLTGRNVAALVLIRTTYVYTYIHELFCYFHFILCTMCITRYGTLAVFDSILYVHECLYWLLGRDTKWMGNTTNYSSGIQPYDLLLLLSIWRLVIYVTNGSWHMH